MKALFRVARKDKMEDTIKFKNHIHRCELQMIYGKYWKKFCPFLAKLLWNEEECDNCAHMVIVNLKDNDENKIDYIERFDDNKKYRNT